MSPKAINQNTLFYGDNLTILREYIPDESVDLIYLDPPFNSNRSYNVLFKNESGQESEAQITAFEDTWHWDHTAARTFYELVEIAQPPVVKMIDALRNFIGENQMMAYLVMMTARLAELHRVLKPTGSLYLHCDPTASHYLKIILDTIFGPQNFRNEVVWKRSYGHGDSRKSMGRSHDVLLYYTKGDKYTLNRFFHEHDPKYLKDFFRHEDKRGRYKLENLTSPNPRPNLTYEYKGYPPPSKGWRVNLERMKQLDADGRLHFPAKKDGRIMKKVYLHELEGQPMTDLWGDIPPISAHDQERLGYPTQKPLSLLERIVQASSNAGDWVLDPFCGCGTAIAAAQMLNRHWIGIDITYLSISLQKYRLKDSFNITARVDYDVIGDPLDLADAHQLAHDNRYQFQWWALSLVGAKPLGGEEGSKKGKKGSDQGIDGIINFVDDAKGGPRSVLVQVKSGHIKSGDIRDLRGVIQRENAAIGVFITLESPTKDMEKEAISADFYTSELWQKSYPTIQILTIEQLLNGTQVNMPPAHGTFKKAEKIKKTEGVQGKMGI
jgi:site-specific DNA-methyltransferase (adenine-specific)